IAFRHALTQRAVADQLLAREKRALHRRIASLLLERGAVDATSYPALSHHLFGAGEWERAAGYAILAGDQAQAVYAPQAAIEQYSRAIECFARLGKPSG